MPEDERWDEPPILDGLDVPRQEFIFMGVSAIEEEPGATWIQQAQWSGSPLGGSEPPPPPPDPSHEIWDEPPDRDDLQRPDKRDADRRWGVAMAGLGLVFLLLGGGIVGLLTGRLSGDQYLQLSLPIVTAVVGAVLGYYLRP